MGEKGGIVSHQQVRLFKGPLSGQWFAVTKWTQSRNGVFFAIEKREIHPDSLCFLTDELGHGEQRGGDPVPDVLCANCGAPLVSDTNLGLRCPTVACPYLSGRPEDEHLARSRDRTVGPMTDFNVGDKVKPTAAGLEAWGTLQGSDVGEVVAVDYYLHRDYVPVAWRDFGLRFCRPTPMIADEIESVGR